jgi:hypothetical protein
MKRLEGLDPEDESFEAELRRLMREIRTHVAKDEGEMFARTPASPTIPENVKPRVRWPASSTGSATWPAGAERPTDRPVPQGVRPCGASTSRGQPRVSPVAV